jgi:flagellar basal-body rod protein FlgB
MRAAPGVFLFVLAHFDHEACGKGSPTRDEALTGNPRREVVGASTVHGRTRDEHVGKIQRQGAVGSAQRAWIALVEIPWTACDPKARGFVADAVETINVLNFALNAIQDRQNVIANNIANADTPGYQANVVDFENSLASAVSAGGDAATTLLPEGLASGTNGNNVSLPAELSLETETNLENQSVANSLSSEFATLSSAITG